MVVREEGKDMTIVMEHQVMEHQVMEHQVMEHQVPLGVAIATATAMFH